MNLYYTGDDTPQEQAATRAAFTQQIDSHLAKNKLQDTPANRAHAALHIITLQSEKPNFQPSSTLPLELNQSQTPYRGEF